MKNLPYDCTEEEVSECFKECGKIAGVRLAVWVSEKCSLFSILQMFIYMYIYKYVTLFAHIPSI